VKDIQSAPVHLKEALKGNSDAIGKLVEAHQELVYSITWKVLGNREDAEDAAQEAFIKCFRNLHKFKGESAFGTWLCSIAYRTAIDLFNIRKNRQARYSSLTSDKNHSEEPAVSLQNETESREIKLILKQAIDALPTDEALMVMLHYYWDMPLREIGQVLNITENNAKVRLHRSRIKLQGFLKQVNDLEAF
jgi:RNA polymerase sigma-70 factor (ECF subfamily)